ncbi:MAG: chromate efflux transporter, partial [Actinobacteria bacterium]|nr:chromate efflux transporter [Actinomycetota bacterium]
FRDAARFWIRLGFINFGGPTGQVAIMHQELVERRRWISNGRFLHALNYCMLLPGPEAQQLAIYVGWLLHKVKGGILAGVAFVLPAFFLILGLSYTYVTYGDVVWIGSVFYGLRAAVIGLVAAAVIRIGQKALRSPGMHLVAGAAFAAIFLFHVPFPLIVLSAGLIGLLAGPVWPNAFMPTSGHGSGEEGETALSDVGSAGDHTRVKLTRAVKVLVIGLLVWLGPLLLIALWRGGEDTLTRQAWFFSGAAMVTFGGAYAVLAYINQAAVTQFGWLLPGQMVTGLGLAESTPGPLIMVTEFVGFVGTYQHPGGLDPFVAGVLGATVATWATFAPCFLWIFLGAPFIERLRGIVRLSTALTTITAAVVGVVLNLAVWFGIHTLFEQVRDVSVFGGPVPVPVWASVDWFAFVVAAVTFVGLWKYRWHVIPVVLGSAIAGLAHGLIP